MGSCGWTAPTRSSSIGCSLEKRGEPTIGERVRAVFAPEREGSMLDVEGFAPADGGTGP